VDEVEIQLAEKEVSDERGLFPLRLTRGFGNLHRLDGALGFDFGHVLLLLRMCGLQDLRQYE
jgi:hypothetical protein